MWCNEEEKVAMGKEGERDGKVSRVGNDGGSSGSRGFGGRMQSDDGTELGLRMLSLEK